MQPTEITLFSEELLKLLAKYGFKGVAGTFMTADSNPLVMECRQPGEPRSFYGFMVDYTTQLLTALNDGMGPSHRGEGKVLVKSPTNNSGEMPN